MDTGVIQVLSLFVCLLGGGGNDLLDYLPTEAYWKQKDVPIRLDTMLGELSPAVAADISGDIAQLGSPDPNAREKAEANVRRQGAAALPLLEKAARAADPELSGRARGLLQEISRDHTVANVRRLMAIRTLGELGQPGAKEALQKLTLSSEPFVADYAASAIAAIAGAPPTRKRPLAEIAHDVWTLPASTGAVLQLAPRGGRPVGYAEVLAAMHAPPDANREERIHELIDPVLEVAELLGNIRVDSLTIGVDQELSNSSGSIVLIGRGLYDIVRLRTVLRQSRTPWHMEGTVEVFEPNGEISVVLVNDHELLLCGSPRPEDRNIAKMLAARSESAPGLSPASPLGQLIQKTNAEGPLWLAMHVNDRYRQLNAALSPFQSLRLTSTLNKGTLTVTMNATGRPGVDPANVAAAAQRVNLDAKQALEFTRPIMQVAPLLRTAVNFLETVQVESAAADATATARLQISPAAVLSLPTAIEQDAPPPDPPGVPPRVR